MAGINLTKIRKALISVRVSLETFITVIVRTIIVIITIRTLTIMTIMIAIIITTMKNIIKIQEVISSNNDNNKSFGNDNSDRSCD